MEQLVRVAAHRGHVGVKKVKSSSAGDAGPPKRWEAAKSSDCARVCETPLSRNEGRRGPKKLLVVAVCLSRLAATGLNIGVVIQNDCFFFFEHLPGIDTFFFPRFCLILEI